MEKIVVFVDDADYAKPLLAPMLLDDRPVAWTLVACPPKLHRKVRKFLTPRAVAQWRNAWADRLLEALAPTLRAGGHDVQLALVTGSPAETTSSLLARQGPARVLDARRPKLAHRLEPVIPGQQRPLPREWALPGAMAGLGAMLVLASD